MRVYKYGLLAPATNADLVADQIYKGHNYQNKLVELEKEKRRALRSFQSPELKLAEETFKEKKKVLDDLIRQQKQANAAARKKVKSAKITPQITEAKKSLKQAKGILFEERKKLKDNDSFREEKDKIQDKYLEGQRALRKDKTIVPWFGTYMLIEEAFKATQKNAPL